MSAVALVAAILLSMASLAWEYAQEGFGPLAIFLLIFAPLWIFALARKWDWFSALGLALAVFTAAIGFWFEFESRWMIAGAVFALFAWDVTEFRRRLREVIMDEDLRAVERRHLARLTILLISGLLLMSVALAIRLQFTFEWAVLLVVVVLLGLAQLLAWFRRQ